MNSDLTRFRRRGGKLLLYHGWADFIVSPQDTINYVDRVSAENGMLALGRQQFARLFMVPGMGHCSGGNGPNTFDALTPLVTWVEQGTPPASIVATKFVNNQPAQGIERTRPLCPYPVRGALRRQRRRDAGVELRDAPARRARCRRPSCRRRPTWRR